MRSHFLFSFSLISLLAQRENREISELIVDVPCQKCFFSGASTPNEDVRSFVSLNGSIPLCGERLPPSQFPSTIQPCSRNHQFFSFKVQLLHIFRHLTTRKEKSAKHAQLMLEIIGQMIKRVVSWKHKSKACYSPNRPDKKGNEMVSFPP